MTTYLVLPDEITTSAQREKVDKIMREVQDYRMKPEEDIVQHVIIVNKKMQEVLWKSHEIIRKNKIQYLTLRGTLIEREHQIILDQLWKILIPRTYWNLIICFVKFIISYGARKIARQKEKDHEELPNWIVEDEYEENQEYLNWIVQYYPEEDTGPEMEENIELNLNDDEELETMIALHYGNESDKNVPIHLFAELAGMEENEELTAYGEEHRAQEPCMVAPISYVDSELTIHGIDIDLNVTPDMDVDSNSDPDMDDVSEDIDDEDVNDDGNINESSVRN
ncbi:hypothetical protein GOBAR_AA07636 [Gossypium barbadense]|uniref:Uncharacterized protein n=1 Tax=Gossypium barbadense TaxID=3634 RepID=A0A2P5YBN1_GOSBA|nr:hypothetical protein GOBAR_AA07636 [Gossypium barbadense]